MGTSNIRGQRTERVHKLAYKLDQVVTRIGLVVGTLAALILAIMVCQVFSDVLLRNVFNYPLPATLEIVSYWWMVALSFLGLMYAKVKGEHISVTLLSETVPRKLRFVATLSSEIITITVLAALAYFSATAALDAMQVGETASGIFPITIWPARFLVPVGTALYALAAISSVLNALQSQIAEPHDQTAGAEGTQHA